VKASIWLSLIDNAPFSRGLEHHRLVPTPARPCEKKKRAENKNHNEVTIERASMNTHVYSSFGSKLSAGMVSSYCGSTVSLTHVKSPPSAWTKRTTSSHDKARIHGLIRDQINLRLGSSKTPFPDNMRAAPYSSLADANLLRTVRFQLLVCGHRGVYQV
jgi:hypothetical protein